MKKSIKLNEFRVVAGTYLPYGKAYSCKLGSMKQGNYIEQDYKTVYLFNISAGGSYEVMTTGMTGTGEYSLIVLSLDVDNKDNYIDEDYMVKIRFTFVDDSYFEENVKFSRDIEYYFAKNTAAYTLNLKSVTVSGGKGKSDVMLKYRYCEKYALASSTTNYDRVVKLYNVDLTKFTSIDLSLLDTQKIDVYRGKTNTKTTYTDTKNNIPITGEETQIVMYLSNYSNYLAGDALLGFGELRESGSSGGSSIDYTAKLDTIINSISTVQLLSEISTNIIALLSSVRGINVDTSRIYVEMLKGVTFETYLSDIPFENFDYTEKLSEIKNMLKQIININMVS